MGLSLCYLLDDFCFIAGPDIIIDMDYYDYMNNMEQSLLAKQLLFMLSENRLLWEPYNLIFSSFYKESIVAQKLTMVVNNLYMDDFPFNYTSKHFTELNYSREELVYLTPHTNNVLLEHTPGSVYIIGKIQSLSNLIIKVAFRS
jgi:tRNA (Guanine-1)-methyltransferase.